MVNFTVCLSLNLGIPAGIGALETEAPTVFTEATLVTLKENVCLGLNPPKDLPAPAAWTCENGRMSAAHARALINSVFIGVTLNTVAR